MIKVLFIHTGSVGYEIPHSPCFPSDHFFCPSGDIVSVYRKSHLFDVELPEKGISLKESAFTIPGPSLVSPVQTPIGKVSFYEMIKITSS